MYELKVMDTFSKTPVFSLSDVNQIINNRVYAKKFLKKEVERNRIFKIKKNIYTTHQNPFLVSTFLVEPSYIPSVSALSHHRLITQIPNEVFCATSKKAGKINFGSQINFSHTNYFFGFKTEEYEGFKISISDPEKAIIDSFSVVPVSVFEDAFESINEANMIEYLNRIKKSSIVKRVGYLMEKNGFDVYKKLRNLINYKYIGLDPTIKPKGKKNRKWGLIINV